MSNLTTTISTEMTQYSTIMTQLETARTNVDMYTLQLNTEQRKITALRAQLPKELQDYYDQLVVMDKLRS